MVSPRCRSRCRCCPVCTWLHVRQSWGVPQNDAKSAKWYRLAADHGLVDAQSYLAALYMLGQGVPKDYVLAYMWLNLAAAQSNKVYEKTSRLSRACPDAGADSRGSEARTRVEADHAADEIGAYTWTY